MYDPWVAPRLSTERCDSQKKRFLSKWVSLKHNVTLKLPTQMSSAGYITVSCLKWLLCSSTTVRFLSHSDNLTGPLQILFHFNHKIVTLQQASSHLRPISWYSVSQRWVQGSQCATVKLLWLDSALSYLFLYFSPAQYAPIDRNGIILHISTYCGQGCGNKHLRWCRPRVSVCGARPRRWKKSGTVVVGRIARGIEQITKYVNTSERGRGEKWTGK